MFLSKIRSDDRGSALILVIAIMGISAIVAIVLGTVTVNALVITDVTRTSVQSQAAAEAGVDTTLASLRANGCSKTSFEASTVPPYYSSEVSFRAGTTGAFLSGCPTGSGQIRVVSTGALTATGLNDPEATKIEAIYEYTSANSGVVPSGAAVYVYSSAGFAGSGQLVRTALALPPGTPEPRVLVGNGNVSCNNNGLISGDLVVASGTFTAASCKVTASAWSSGLMTLNWSGDVSGNATAGSLDLQGGKVSGNAWAAGNAKFPQYASTVAGSLTAKSVTGTGTASLGNTIIPAGPGPGPIAPIVPKWVDYSYSHAHWVGFNEVKLSVCGPAELQAAIDLLAAKPGVIDATNCTSGINVNNGTNLRLKNDLVIVAKSFVLGGAQISATQERKLWLISPDNVPDGAPATCLPALNTSIANGFVLDLKISALIYTPCRVSLAGGITWQGQMFAGATTIDNGATLKYVPLGLPLVDLNTGAPAGTGTSTIGEPYSVRDYVGE